MRTNRNDSVSAMQHRINAEIQDNLDEDLELELEDGELADLLAEGPNCRIGTPSPAGSISPSSCACSANSLSCRTGWSPRG